MQTLLSYPAASIILALTIGVSLAAFYRRDIASRLLLYPAGLQQRKHMLVTYGFVHADAGHLLFNAVSYASIAFILEEALGAVDFITVYFGSLVLGAVPSVIRNRHNASYRALGASGAVSGLFFSGMLFYPSGKIHLFFLPVGMPYPLFAALFLALSWYGARRNKGVIAHDAHFYGSLAGLLLTVLLRPDSLAGFIETVF